jgi:oligopeptide transport system substrate-binding protein
MPADLHVDPYLGTYYYAFNLTRPPFKDNPTLRAALSMAVDRDALTEHITGAGEQPAFSLVPPGVQRYDLQRLDYAALPPAERIAEARRLYREAGYGPDRPLEIELRYNTSDNHKRIAVAVAAMWKQVLGVRTQLLNEEWKVFLQNRKQKAVTQVFRSGWIGDYNDAYTFLDLFESKNGRNDSGYVNPRFDALLDRAQAEQDAAARRGLLERAERMLLADHAIVPLYYYVSKHMIKPYVSGYVPNILDYHYTRHLDLRPH